MGRINYNCLRGKVHAFAPAAPATNPHLWVLLEENGRQWFATINIRSDKDAPSDPVGKSYLYYLIDNDFRHPVVPDDSRAPDRTFARGPRLFLRRARFPARQYVRSAPDAGSAR